MRRFLILPLLAALMLVSGAADDDSTLLSRLVNNPGVANWNISGLASTPLPRSDDAVQGGKALRVTVSSKGANPWDVAAAMPIEKPVKRGDTLLVAVWARVETPPGGKTGAQLPILIQKNGAPYTTVAVANVTITGKWAMYYLSTTLTGDWPKAGLTVSLQLAGAAQTIDLGPALVFDLGQNYDAAKLPQNPVAADNSPAGDAGLPPFSETDAARPFAVELARIRALLPVPGHLINDPAVTSNHAYGPGQSNETVDASDVPGGRALRVHVQTGGGDPWLVGTGSVIRGDIHKGDTIFFAFYANAREVSNEAQSGVISAINVQRNSEPYDTVAGTAALVPLNKWRVFYGAGVARSDIAAGHGVITAQIGSRKQTIDVGPAFVLDLGPGVAVASLPQNRITYPGREANAPWRAAAQARIRKIRMGDLSVTVTDAGGRPVPGASVHFAMQKHRFHFGTFIGHNIANSTGPDADKTRAIFLKSFNFATSPIYWGDWAWGNPDHRKNYIDSMAWLQAHGIAFRAHPIVYPNEGGTPSYVKAHIGDKAAVADAVLDHVREVVPYLVKYGACCSDAVNEPRTGQYLPSIAGDDIFLKIYRTAHALAPNLKLFVNDYGIISGGGENQKNLDYYHHWIDDMLAKGAPLGGIGIQGHFGADLTDPARVIAILDDFGKYNLPIQITEFDVDTTDEAAQADYTRDMLTAVFSQPQSDAFVVWGFWEGDHWKPDAAMLRRDWSEKPNYKVWMKLIYHDWWTDETKPTGADGVAQTRAFYGDYRITVTAKGKTVVRGLSFAPGTGALAITMP
jgi:GH35 family endo-1,4-beta-xylanase